MAQFAVAVPYIMAAIAVVGAYSDYQEGQSANDAAKLQAQQLTDRANNERAAAQYKADNQRRELRYLQSRAQAVAAASGAGATDPSVLNIMGNNAMEGERHALASLWEGEDMARGLEYEASVTRWKGKVAKQQGNLSAATGLLMAAGSMFGGFGTGAPGGAGKGAAGVGKGAAGAGKSGSNVFTFGTK